MSGVGSGAHGPTEPHPLDDTMEADRLVDEKRIAAHQGGEGAGLSIKQEFDKFTLNIELGNAAMQSGPDVANALERVWTEVDDGHTEGTIRDLNGNTVGVYGFEAAPPAPPPPAVVDYCSIGPVEQTDGSWTWRCMCGMRGHNHANEATAIHYGLAHLERVHDREEY